MRMISIVIPAYNEGENLKRIEKELIGVLSPLKLDYEVVVVNDGSRDNTAKEVEKLHKKFPFVRLVNHETNKGMACGIITGINNAKGGLLITLDADLTFHPKDIPKLLERFGKGDVDIVIGSHVLGGTKDIPFYRVFLSRACNLIYAVLLGKHITAISPIFRLYKTSQLKELGLVCRPQKQGGFDINAEILFKLLQRGRKVAEVPVVLGTRTSGVSKMNSWKATVMHLKMLRKILIWRIKAIFGRKK